MRLLPLCAALALGACASPRPAAPPCFVVNGSNELRAKDSEKTLAELAKRIRLSPEDEALRSPKSIADVRAILRRDTVYLFGEGATFARGLQSKEGRFLEATLELLMGESQLVASQVLTVQAAWVGGDLRIARAALASEGAEPSTDRGRMLANLIRVVEEGNRISDALGAVAPAHLTRGAEVVRTLRAEAPDDPRTAALVAETHRLRGEWSEFDAAMQVADAGTEDASRSRAICYLRAMEQLERFHKPELGAKAMRECVKKFPGFVRAQAALVLMATRPAAALRELAKLKEVNQDHYLVMLLEPTLAAEQELGRMQGSDAER